MNVRDYGMDYANNLVAIDNTISKMSSIDISCKTKICSNRNTKKLSLKLNNNDKLKDNLTYDKLDNAPSLSDLKSHNSDTHIYTLPKKKLPNVIIKKSKSTNSSPVEPSIASKMRDIKRNQTLPVSINTTNVNTINKDGTEFINTYSNMRLQTLTPTSSLPQSETESHFLPFDKQFLPITALNNIDNTGYSKEVHEEFAYPHGPMLVIEPYIYLYSEPSLTEICDFDIVINVAKEIPNLGPLIPNNLKLDYYHIPWTHNSKIFLELKHVTDIMHSGVIAKKKILIHCQCGISRSASLIVAYIMRYSKLSLNDAYDKLKNIVTLISPNMSLIFQLMEWNDFLKNEKSSSNDIKQPQEQDEIDHRQNTTNDISLIQTHPELLNT
ncbi:hypothetical protein TPHA_0F01230 [Tetrapisispora phaffii CBS 4417]|uniref:protein-tyrosine-phosphatase n=1 Tax=Tetrapisispora phaffii (strain ATCC 24235 / CBS 4417 / NBRC 1672 / NRRL Y-8282 / UCD 70-5) TaxID=1071381 RepID=G8BV26_TETPH|nr:hypothetical protein TPHA_0F01230 [Tetrapisispora phaffii CBS 4417]CCE63608.1 hypothetical protein TPHA_0F01230 [Tetrapisispora phaffii CBS 4417]